MIRPFAVVVASLATLSLVACQPTAERDGRGVAGAVPLGDAMPASYDWHFTPHGGSGELDFGDGDGTEAVNVFTLTCLPGSKTVEMSWDYEDEAVLTSGTATGTFRPASSVSTDEPVINALKASGAIDVGLSGADMRLSAKDAGRAQMAAFFDYCDKSPRSPAVVELEPPAPLEEQAPVTEEAAPEVTTTEASAAETPATGSPPAT